MPVPPGTKIGAYEIVAPLGIGGMGEVYRARDSKLGRDVAIKILPAPFTSDPERRARFAREARLLATLNHPHIGSIYGLEESDGLTALVLELVEGPTLADRLSVGPLPVADSLIVATQIAEALEEAHEKGIIHRDLKPANIVLQRDGESAGGSVRAKVLDFGLAKSLAVPGSNDVTQEQPPSQADTAHGRVVGTPAYMSPEQARGLAVDKRTDVWAFGCVLYEMVTGRRPFDGATTTDTLAQILDREPDWSLLPDQTPAAIGKLLQRCLRKDRRRRLHDIADAILDLNDVAGSESRNTIATARRSSDGSRAALLWLLVAALGAGLLTASYFYFRSRAGAPTEAVEFAITPAEHSRLTGGFAMSPDGRHVALTASHDGTAMIWVRTLATTELRMLPGTEGGRSPSAVLGPAAIDPPWQRGAFSVSTAGRLVYRHASRTPSQLTWRDRHGAIQALVGDPGVYFNVDLSGDNRRIAVSQLRQPPGEKAQFDIWIFNLDRENAATRLTGDPGWEFDPAWSPDGRVVFNSNKPDPEKSPLRLFVRPSDGTPDVVVLS